MELVVLWRVLAWFVVTCGLAMIGMGPGGIVGTQCRLGTIPLRISASNLMDWSAVKVRAPAFNCTEPREPLVLVAGYFPIDTLFGNLPRGNAPGLPAQLRLRLPVSYFKETAGFYREQTIGLDNVAYANSIGIKLAFLIALFAWVSATFVILSVKQVICYTNARVLLLEKLLLVLCISGDIVGGLLAVLWGTFKHVDPNTLGPARDLMCFGWLGGGTLLLFAALIQFLDLVLTLSIKPKPMEDEEEKENKAKPGEKGEAKDRGPGAKSGEELGGAPTTRKDKKKKKQEKKKGLFWQSFRAPPPGYDNDYYSMYSSKKEKTEKEDKSKAETVKEDKSKAETVKEEKSVHEASALKGPRSEKNIGLVPKAAVAKDEGNQISLATERDGATEKGGGTKGGTVN